MFQSINSTNLGVDDTYTEFDAGTRAQGFRLWLCQFDALCRKNAEVLFRRKWNFFGQLLTPVISVLLLLLTTEIVKMLASSSSNAPVPLTPSACIQYDRNRNPSELPLPCTTVGFVPNTEPYVSVMQHLAAGAGWTFGQQVRGFDSIEQLARFMFGGGQLSALDAGVVFNTTTASSVVQYSLWVNATVDGAVPYHYAGLQVAVETAILAQVGGVAAANVQVTLQQFTDLSPGTKAADDFEGVQSVITFSAPVVLLFGAMVVFLMQLNLIVAEKKAGLLGHMRMMGLREGTYWLSWLATFSGVAVLSALLFATAGKATQITVFSNTAFGVLFLLYFSVSVCLAGYAVFWASFMKQPRWVIIMSLIIILEFIIPTVVFTSILQGGSLSWFNSQYNPTTGGFSSFLNFMQPWFHFDKVITDVLAFTQQTPGLGVQNTFTWSMLTYRQPVGSGPTQWFCPSVGYSMGCLVALAVVYTAIAWYVAQVWGGEFSKRFYFPLTKAYWGLEQVDTSVFAGDTAAEVRLASKQYGDIRLYKLSKSYDKTTALKELSLTMRNNEIFCLLGHNGAGKTTTINCMVGLHNATHGDAFVFGMSINHQMSDIQSTMGVCPQHDILFPELSGRSHLLFWAMFKGVPRHKAAAHVDSALDDVNLADAATAPAISYSGGMKRRLSLAIAAAGDPRVLFLDEPTTGLDPLSRRRVWKVIERMKRDRVVCLSTHSMEEADALGNEIAILASGRLRAIGSSLFLKNRFGKGYQISLMTEESTSVELIDVVKKLVPGADILSNTAGYVVVGIPRKNYAFIPAFFAYLESDPQQLVKEWGISNTTLQEVFLRLAGQNKKVNAGVEGVASSDESHDSFAPAYRLQALGSAVELGELEGKQVMIQQVVLMSNTTESAVKLERDIYTLEYPNKVSAADDDEEFEMDLSLSVEEQKIAATAVTAAAAAAATTATATTTAAATAQAVQQAQQQHLRQDDEGFGRITCCKQIRALLLKSASFQKHQKKTNICSLLFLLTLVIMTLLLGLLIGNDDSQGPVTCSPNVTSDCACAESGARWGDGFIRCTEDGFTQKVVKDFQADLSSGLYDNQRNLCAAPANGSLAGCSQQEITPGVPSSDDVWVSAKDFRCWSTKPIEPISIWFSDSGSGPNRFLDLNVTGLGVGVLNSQYQRRGTKNTPSLLNFVDVSTRGFGTVDAAVQASQRTVLSKLTQFDSNTCPYCWISNSPYKYMTEGNATTVFAALFPDFGVDIALADVNNLKLHYSLNIFKGVYPLTRVVSKTEGYGCQAVEAESWNFISNNQRGQPLATVISGMTRSLINTATMPSLSSIQSSIINMPNPTFYKAADLATTEQLVALMLLPFATMLVLPSLVRSSILEKSSNVLMMMKMQGLNGAVYWFSTWLWQMLTFLTFTGFFLILNYGAGVPVYQNSNVAALVFTQIVWGHAVSSFALLLSAVMKKESLATLVATMLIVLQTVLGMAVGLGARVSSWPSALNAFPQFSYIRATLLAFRNKPAEHGDLWSCIAFLLLEASTIILLALFVHLRALNESPDAPAFSCCKRNKLVHVLRSEYSSHLEEDVDVANERARVQQGNAGNAAITMVHLAKTFPGTRGRPPKQAVKDLSFAIEYNEVFGLLGPNGAGKTTTLHMLSGHLSPTAGATKICNYDVVTEMAKVHGVLGMCPQFDWVWEDLTVEDHLLLYVRLKGAEKFAERALITRIAEAVDLDGDAMRTYSHSLSGGMRRRLSLAISLCGNPKVVFLDEPTTGLDPETREEIWKIIHKAKNGRCIVMTTHSMEEADALCERIGIIANGSLQCLGSQLHLKNRFGKGYQLKVNLVEADNMTKDDQIKGIDACVKELAPGAELTSEESRNRCYILPREGTSVSAVFKTMEAHRRSLGIREWGINMTSLEEVFMHIAEAAEEQEQQP